MASAERDRPAAAPTAPADRRQQTEPAEPADRRHWLQVLVGERHLSPAQRRIAGYLLDHPEVAADLTADELGRRSGASQPSVTRFAVALGFSGYPELREQIGVLTAAPPEPPAGGAADGSALARTVDRDTANLRRLVTSPWAGARVGRVGALLAGSSPLPVLGLRVSHPLAALFGYFAAKVHRDVRLVPHGSPGEDVLATARDAGAGWLLAFGLPRYPRELAEMVRFARGRGLRVALLTDSPLCPLAPDVDELLAAPVNDDLTFDSAVAPLALTMALLQALIDALPDRGQARLDEFDQRAAERGLFVE